MLFGVDGGPYWLSWIITIFIFDIIYAGLMTEAGNICGFSIFLNMDFWMVWLLFFTLLFSHHSVCLLMCTFCRDRKSGTKFGYGYMLYSLFIHLLFGEGTFIKLFYLLEMGSFMKMFKFFLSLNPSFTSMSAIVNYAGSSGNRWDGNDGTWITGKQYQNPWFWNKIDGVSFGSDFSRPSPFLTNMLVLGTGVGYLLLIYFADNLN